MNDRVQISKRLLLINSTSGALTRILNVAVLAWVLHVLYQRISAAELSILPLVMAVVAVVPIFTSMFTWALSRFVTEAHAQGDDRRVTEITSTMFATLLPVGLLILMVGLFVIQYADAILTIEPEYLPTARLMFSLLFGQTVIRLIAAPFAVGLFVHQRFVRLNMIELASTLVRIALLAVLIFGIGPRVMWVVVAQVVGNVLQDVGKTVCSLWLMPALRFRRREIRWQSARMLIGFNAWSVLNHVAWFIHDSAPAVILNRFASPIEVSTLLVPMTADVQLRNFVQSTTIPMLPMLTAMQAMNQVDRLRSGFLRGSRLSLWLIMYFVVSLTVYREEVMRLFLHSAFDTYPDSGMVLGLFLAAYLFYLPRLMLMKVAYAQGRVRAVVSWNLASQLCNLALTLYLVAILHAGAVGAGVSTLSIEIVWYVAVWAPLSVWLMGIPMSQYVRDVFVRGSAPAAVCAIGSELLRQLVQPTGIVSVGLCMMLGLLIYAVVLFGGCLTKTDRADLLAIKAKLFNEQSAP